MTSVAAFVSVVDENDDSHRLSVYEDRLSQAGHLQSIMYTLCRIILILASLVALSRSRGYDDSPLTFDPSGRILQVDYAMKSIANGDPVVCMKCADGVIVMTGKAHQASSNTGRRAILSKSSKRITIEEHISIFPVGLLFDSIAMTDHCKAVAAKYKRSFGEPIPIDLFVDQVAADFHRATAQAPGRPFGLGLVAVGYDRRRGYEVYSILPDGSSHSWNGLALGRKSTETQASLANSLKFSSLFSASSPRGAVVFPELKKSLQIMKKEIMHKHFPSSKSISDAGGSSIIEDDDPESKAYWDAQVRIHLSQTSANGCLAITMAHSCM
jgi:20S proteasome alpha/beta subunit